MHQGLVLLHATHAKMSVQSQIKFFIKQSVNRIFIMCITYYKPCQTRVLGIFVVYRV